MTMTTASASATTAGSAEAASRPLASTGASGSDAPGSRNGSRPARTVDTASSLMSNTATDAPRSAKAMASGSPTWPQPPTIATSVPGPAMMDSSDEIGHLERAKQRPSQVTGRHGADR